MYFELYSMYCPLVLSVVPAQLDIVRKPRPHVHVPLHPCSYKYKYGLHFDIDNLSDTYAVFV